jgi:hypothetical protein
MAVIYSADIKPLFRPQDLQCMANPRRKIFLDDVQWMCDATATFGYPDHGNARWVFDKIDSGEMPPDQEWSQANKDKYTQWMQDGFLA